MTQIQSFPLDYAQRIHLQLQPSANGRRLVFRIASPGGRVAEELIGMMQVKGGAREDGLVYVPMPEIGENLDVSFNGHHFFYLQHPADDQWRVPTQSQRLLTSTECRMIGRAPQTDFPAAEAPGSDNLSTDLHTHLSSQLTGRQLLDIGIRHQILYPTATLDKLGIHYPGESQYHGRIPFREFLPEAHMRKGPKPETQEAVALSVENPDGTIHALLSPKDEAKLAAAMDLNGENQNVFGDLEQCFFRREPFTKNFALLKDMLNAVADGYKRANPNFKYAELSTNAITDPGWLAAIGPIAEDIEVRTGVRLRFLAGIPRNLNDAGLQKRIGEIVGLGKDSKYVVGVDWLGYETNKTAHITHHISELGEWMLENRPDWVQRIHAGENSKNQRNVEECLDLVEKLGVRIRIGHATHGVSEKTAERAHAMYKAGYDFAIETLPDSNIATNTIDFPADTSIKLFVKKRVPTFIGSDGAGVYGTDTVQSAHSARLAGLNKKDLGFLQDVEEKYILEQEAREKSFSLKKSRGAYAGTLPPQTDIDVEAEQTLPMLAALPQDARRPIFVAGSNGTSWKEMPEEERQKTLHYFQALIFGGLIDPRKHYLVLGRMKDEGLGHEIAQMVAGYNRVLYETGALPSASSAQEAPAKPPFAPREGEEPLRPLDCLVIGTDALTKPLPQGVSGYYRMDVPLVYVPEKMMQLLHEQKTEREGPPILIPAGGGTFTRDMIKLAKDAGWYVAPLNIRGASQEKGRLYKDDMIRALEDLPKFEKKSGLVLMKERRPPHYDWTKDVRLPAAAAGHAPKQGRAAFRPDALPTKNDPSGKEGNSLH